MNPEQAIRIMEVSSTDKPSLPWGTRANCISTLIIPLMADIYLNELREDQRKRASLQQPQTLFNAVEGYIQYQKLEDHIQYKEIQYQIVNANLEKRVREMTSQIQALVEEADTWRTKYEEVRRSKYIMYKNTAPPAQQQLLTDKLKAGLTVLTSIVEIFMPQGFRKSKKLGFTNWWKMNHDPQHPTLEDIRLYTQKYFMRSRMFMEMAREYYPAKYEDSIWIKFDPAKVEKHWTKEGYKYFESPFWQCSKIPEKIQIMWSKKTYFKGIQWDGPKNQSSAFDAINLVLEGDGQADEGDGILIRKKKEVQSPFDPRTTCYTQSNLRDPTRLHAQTPPRPTMPFQNTLGYLARNPSPNQTSVRHLSPAQPAKATKEVQTYQQLVNQAVGKEQERAFNEVNWRKRYYRDRRFLNRLYQCPEYTEQPKPGVENHARSKSGRVKKTQKMRPSTGRDQ